MPRGMAWLNLYLLVMLCGPKSVLGGRLVLVLLSRTEAYLPMTCLLLALS